MAECSSVERTWSPAVAENAAPAMKSAAKVSAAATRRVRDRRFGTCAAATGGSVSSSPFSSHSSHACPWRSLLIKFFFPSRRRHTRCGRDWSSDVCSSDLLILFGLAGSRLVEAGRAAGLTVAEEVFADRTYQPDGTLTPRTDPRAMVRDPEEAVRRVLRKIGRAACRERVWVRGWRGAMYEG